MNAYLDKLLFLAAVGFILLYRLEYLLQLLAEEHRNDGGGCFGCAEAQIVCSARDRYAEHILIIVHRLDDRTKHQQKLCILVWCFARLKQIYAGVRGNRPVVVLAAAVYTCKGLFVEQAHHIVLSCELFHKLHGYLIMVGGDIRR